MTKDFILSEIKRVAAQSRGSPPGREKFAKITGIKQAQWYGRYWSRWGDALKEAGFDPNEFQLPHNEENILGKIAQLARELGRFPVTAELRMKARADKSFPSHGVYDKLGPKPERVRKVLDWCRANPGFEDVVTLCQSNDAAPPIPVDESPATEPILGFVYLARMGKHYKVGRTGAVGRRVYELAIQLPERLTLIHSIKTDDPTGIEAYWHGRFADRRSNGEWFILTSEDVKAFKRRTFM